MSEDVTSNPESTPLWRAYQSRLDAGLLSPDAAQAEAVRRLAAFTERLALRSAPANRGFLARLLRRRQPAPRGVYLWGSVGRGKTMLMDLFFEYAPWEPKRRVHFHSFMRDMHAWIHAWRQERLSHAEDSEHADPIPPLAACIASESALLCFDEMQVTDVTDAMLIRRLFEALRARGVAMVFTSNRPPNELYLNGLQRGQFLPFIEFLEQEMEVVELASPTDFRRRQLSQLDRSYHAPLGTEAAHWLEAQFLTLAHGQTAHPLEVRLPGRSWRLAQAVGDMAKTDFATLCGQALGASDYIELARRISTLLLADIPLLSPAMRNESKRFVTLIDVLYEAKVKLLATAAAAPDALYPKGDGSFEFARTASRLIEMQSAEYRALPWQRPSGINQG